jgi:plastocyanin
VSVRVRLAVLSAAIVALSCGEPQGAASERHAVEIREFMFQPDTLRVAAGDTVVWTNRDVVPHTATSDVWDSGALERGSGWVLVAVGSDTIGYVCTLHPTMTGTLIIEDRPGRVTRSGITGGMHEDEAK